MRVENAINDPAGELVINDSHRGDIRCKTLMVTKNGSVFGNVSADIVRIAGTFDGTIDSVEFYAAAGSHVFGAINAEVIGIKPGSDFRGYLGRNRPFRHLTSVPPSTEDVIQSGVAQAKKALVVAAQPKAQTEFPCTALKTGPKEIPSIGNGHPKSYVPIKEPSDAPPIAALRPPVPMLGREVRKSLPSIF